MLAEYENPAKPQFWLKWLFTIVFIIAGSFGCYKFILMKESAFNQDLDKRIFASERQMIQIANGINLFYASHSPNEITSLVGYEAVMTVLKDNKLLDSIPKNIISNYEFYGDGLEFIGMRFEEKKLCEKFMANAPGFKGVEKFKEIGLASKKIGFKKNAVGQVFCYRDSSRKNKDHYTAALKIDFGE